jgi:hypothetical protein
MEILTSMMGNLAGGGLSIHGILETSYIRVLYCGIFSSIGDSLEAISKLSK